jgi:hypothetical protein
VSNGEMTTTVFVFPVFSVTAKEKCCDACGDGIKYLQTGLPTLQDDGVPRVSTTVDQMMSGHTVCERSWEDADFLCISCI